MKIFRARVPDDEICVSDAAVAHAKRRRGGISTAVARVYRAHKNARTPVGIFITLVGCIIVRTRRLVYRRDIRSDVARGLPAGYEYSYCTGYINNAYCID